MYKLGASDNLNCSCSYNSI